MKQCHKCKKYKPEIKFKTTTKKLINGEVQKYRGNVCRKCSAPKPTRRSRTNSLVHGFFNVDLMENWVC